MTSGPHHDDFEIREVEMLGARDDWGPRVRITTGPAPDGWDHPHAWRLYIRKERGLLYPQDVEHFESFGRAHDRARLWVQFFEGEPPATKEQG